MTFRRRGGFACVALLALAAAAPTAARTAPQAYASADPRIRIYAYDPGVITPLVLTFGFQTMLQFGADERIENVSIGDGAAWQITPNKAATLLFVKPVDLATRTNMTVVTDHRSYLFELVARARGRGDPPYLVRFTYPPEKANLAVRPPPPERRNTAYVYTGSRDSLPAEVFDDGRFTYFRWPEDVAIPALFQAAPDGSESLVNYSVRDGFQIVEQVAQRFVLRNGKSVTTVINQAWREPSPGPGAPLPADAKTARALVQAEGRR